MVNENIHLEAQSSCASMEFQNETPVRMKAGEETIFIALTLPDEFITGLHSS